MATNLLRLLVSNRGVGKFSVLNEGDEATLYLYDAIVGNEAEAQWFGGVAADTFVKALNGITAPTIHLRINSPGGDVFAGRAMEQAIRAHPSNIVAHIDGLAASAASYVALAADDIEIATGGFVMIHNAWSIAMGNADDLMQVAALLEKIDGTLVDTYVGKTGQDAAQVRAWMDAETWFTAQEAVDAGFADRIAETTAKNEARWDLSAYRRAPAAAAEDPAPVRELTLDAGQEAEIAENHHARRERQLALIARTA